MSEATNCTLGLPFKLLHQMETSLGVVQILLQVHNVSKFGYEVDPLGWGTVENRKLSARQVLLNEVRQCDAGCDSSNCWNSGVSGIGIECVNPCVNIIHESETTNLRNTWLMWRLLLLRLR